MGVPGFNTWFARNNRHAYVSYFNMSWDHVYIDMASVLHGAMKSGVCSHGRQLLSRHLYIHVCLCVRSTQPSPLSQDTFCSFGLHHGFSHSSEECHVCARWTSTLGKASNTEVLLCATPSLLSVFSFSVMAYKAGCTTQRMSADGPWPSLTIERKAERCCRACVIYLYYLELHCKVTLQTYTAESHCRIILQSYTAKLHCIAALQSYTAL